VETAKFVTELTHTYADSIFLPEPDWALASELACTNKIYSKSSYTKSAPLERVGKGREGGGRRGRGWG